ncbi:hypothetical protein DE146DRAFT_778367 [Phaeosphaeria sp. MPI-PUGE-AT-0046c]|nr:hypothetical protein DE146DRAFT_778367 [Phaeosphaeria sp. MPI-PUGE-AT-0046c]
MDLQNLPHNFDNSQTTTLLETYNQLKYSIPISRGSFNSTRTIMSQNPDAVANQGEFRGKVAPSEPMMTSGHQPGKLVGNDAASEFSAETLPAGSAPTSKTYQPNPDLNNQKMFQDASATLTGATSGDVHTGLGHPGQGQTSKELHHEKKGGQGLAGLADSVGQGNVKDLKDDPTHAAQRNLDNVPTGQRGNNGGVDAQERVPESASSVAAETTNYRK